MRHYETLEKLISSAIEAYKTGFNTHNPEYEVDFFTTLTNHHVEVQNVKAWVAYLRMERAIRPKGGTDDDWERLLIYNQAYKFKDIRERTEPNAPWKYDLYYDLLQRLIHGGIEYAELLKRMQMTVQANKDKPLAEALITPQEPKIIVTDKMPAPLSDDEKSYQEWVKKNSERK